MLVYIKKRGFPADATMILLPGCPMQNGGIQMNVPISIENGEAKVDEQWKRDNLDMGLTDCDFAIPLNKNILTKFGDKNVKVVNSFEAAEYIQNL